MNELILMFLALGLQDGQPAEGLRLERRVRVVTRDLSGKASEIHRREVLTIHEGKVAVDDLTFGTRLVIRPDRKLLWVIDPPGGTYSEITFDALAERRKRILEDLTQARLRVAGTQEADDIDKILIGLGFFSTPPAVEVRDTGKTEEVAGRRCAGREIVVNGIDHPIEVFVDPSLSDGAAYLEALAASGAWHPAVAEKVRALGGFPMKGKARYALFLDRVFSDEEVTAVARAPVRADAFERPATLRQVPLAGFDPDAGPRPEKPKNFEHSYREDEIDRENNPLRDKSKEPK
ncbi:MAG: hypothetical protein HYY16_16380 [Planctomycetes bacterium]|nr:hypothetical protein [Planctomycetota bacterium]